MKLNPARAALIAQARTALEALISPMGAAPSLMETLADMITPGSSGGSSGVPAAPSAKNIMNFAAFDLQAAIIQEVAERLALLTGEAGPRGPVHEELQRLYDLSTRQEQLDEQISKIAARFESWACQIQELIEPVPELNLPGACPVCQADQARVHSNPGELTSAPEFSITTALVARGETAGCRCCHELWIGILEMRRLSAQLHGSTVVALAAERRRRSTMDAAVAEAQAMRAA